MDKHGETLIYLHNNIESFIGKDPWSELGMQIGFALIPDKTRSIGVVKDEVSTRDSEKRFGW